MKTARPVGTAPRRWVSGGRRLAWQACVPVEGFSVSASTQGTGNENSSYSGSGSPEEGVEQASGLAHMAHMAHVEDPHGRLT